MVKKVLFFTCLILFFVCESSFAEDKIELKITKIQGNKELPKILYVVPWKDIQQAKHKSQKLELHSLFGDLFDPILPSQEASMKN